MFACKNRHTALTNQISVYAWIYVYICVYVHVVYTIIILCIATVSMHIICFSTHVYMLYIADAKPCLRDLQKMTYIDEDGTCVQFRLMERMRPQARQVAIALGFPHHDITTINRTSDPVYYLLSKWLQGGNPKDQRPLTWATLITALQDAGVNEEACILEQYLVEPEPDVHDDETLPEGKPFKYEDA